MCPALGPSGRRNRKSWVVAAERQHDPARRCADMLNSVLVLLAALAWFGVEVYRQVGERRRRATAQAPADRGSLVLLYAGITCGYSVAFAASFSPFGHLPGSSALWLVVGASLVVAGLWIRHAAMQTLAASFAYQVRIQTDQHLVTSGVYRRVRHPGYLGQLLVFAGLGVGLANWVSIIGLLAPVIAAFGWRIHVEEAELRQHFGSSYEAYRRGTWRLIPGLF
jgi:protein-S-isoprenylcysteine O-methyltransferase